MEAAADPVPPDRGRLGRRARVDPRGVAAGARRDRDGLPRRRRPRRAQGRRRGRPPGQPARPVRPGDGRGADQDGAVALHAPCDEPGARPRDRRHWTAFGSVGVGAERRRPGPRPAGRQPRGLPEPDPALPDAQPGPLLRRLPGRADRHPRVGAPSRCALGPADPRRQADPCLLARPAADHRRDRDGPDRARASTTRRSSASRRCSRSSTRRRRSGSTRRCSTGSSRCRRATRSSA